MFVAGIEYVTPTVVPTVFPCQPTGNTGIIPGDTRVEAVIS